MKKSISILAVLVLMTVLMTTAVQQNKPKETEYLSASWNYNYKDIEELSKSSDLIALVKVEKIDDMVVKQEIPFTIFSVKVITPVYHTAENATFQIYQTGGEMKEEIVEIVDDPLLQIGDEMLVFCKENSDGTYQILSGSQGRLVYDNGKLNSLNEIDERIKTVNPYSNVKIKNADADILMSEIRRIKDAEDSI